MNYLKEITARRSAMLTAPALCLGIARKQKGGLYGNRKGYVVNG
jgi:hypothetical protein